MEALLSLLLPLVFVLLVLAMVRTPRRRGGGRVPANPPPPPKAQRHPPLPPHRKRMAELERNVEIAAENLRREIEAIRASPLRSPNINEATRNLRRIYDESLVAIEGEDAAWKREVELSLLRHDSEKLDRIRKMVVGTFDASGQVKPMEAYISFMQIADEFAQTSDS